MAVGIVLFFLVEKVVRYVDEHHSGYAHHHHHHLHNKQHSDANEDSNQEITEKQITDGEKTKSKALRKVLCLISCVFSLRTCYTRQ